MGLLRNVSAVRLAIVYVSLAALPTKMLRRDTAQMTVATGMSGIHSANRVTVGKDADITMCAHP
jgi:hypothetical protein